MRSKHKKTKEEIDKNVLIENSTGRIAMFVVYAPDIMTYQWIKGREEFGIAYLC